MVRTSKPQKPPQKSFSRAAGARFYPYRNALSRGPNADPRLSREETLNCKRQAQVCARRSALQCPLTVDIGPDETMQRDQELDFHRLRQTEYSTTPAFAFAIATTSRLLLSPNDPLQVDISREPAPPDPRLSPPRFRTDRELPCKAIAQFYTQHVIDKDVVLPAAPPLYLPMHQQDVSRHALR